HTSFSRDWSSDVCSSDLWCKLRIIMKFFLKNIWAKKLRTLLIIISVTLSPALYFATEALSDTVADMFDERMRVYFGTADLMIYRSEERRVGMGGTRRRAT